MSAGFAVTLTTIATIPGSFAGGKIADHIGRKKSYIIFQIAAAFFLLLCVFTLNPKIIIALVCISTFFNGGVRPIISAMITDVLPADKRQIGFSLSYLGINLGVALGPIVAGFLFNHYIPLMFIGDAATSFLAVTLVIFNIKETLPANDNKNIREEEKSETGNVFTVLFKRPRILIFLIIDIFICITYTQTNFSLPMMMTHVFGSNGAKNYGFIMSSNAITVLVMTAIVTRKIRKWNVLSVMAVSGLLYVIGFGMITFIHSMPLYILSTFIWTIGEVMNATNFGVYIANNTPQNFRARFNAVTSLSWGIGAVIGTSFMGRYIDYMGINAVWPLVSVMALIGAAGMYLLKLKTEN